MNTVARKFTRLVLLVSICSAFIVGFVPSVLALDPPAITVNPVWRPAIQLDSIDTGVAGVTNAGDDLRYADVEIYVTTSVQFWAAELLCTVDKTVLEDYANGGTDTGLNPSPDEVNTVVWGTEWASAGGVSSFVVNNTTSVDGKINIAASRVGTAAPIGSNGVKKTFNLATIRYRVKDLAAAKTTAFTCTTSFLNRDGKVVLAAVFTPPAPLSVLTGYTLNGKVSYQDLAPQAGILVQCQDDNGAFYPQAAPLNVPATGLFSLTGLRQLGTYDCKFYGSKVNVDTTTEDVHLTSRTSFSMNSAVYNLLPITLRTGNVNRDTFNAIDFNDINNVTAFWNQTGTAYTKGDANGDTKTDKTDLTLIAGNIVPGGLYQDVNASHFIYSLPRDNEKFMNSHIWMGNYYGEASVTQFVPGTERNYWATLAPDGSKIAFTRNIGVDPAMKYALFVAPITNGVVGAPVNITTGAAFDAFAPSWSPDGSRIAFVCSPSRVDWTMGKGRGNLCLVDPTGKNLQTVALPASNNMVNIHPPAWFNNTSLMYGSPDWFDQLPAMPGCNNRICRVDLTNGNNQTEPNIQVGSDMPTIRKGIMGSVVFYRTSNGIANDVIRFAELSDIAVVPSVMTGYGCANPVNSKHCDVATGVNFNQIGYFNVYTGNNSNDYNVYGIVFYSQDENTSNGGGFNYTLMDWNGSTSAPSWTKYWSSWSPADVVGNPDMTLPNTPNYPNPEGFTSLRNTVEWNP